MNFPDELKYTKDHEWIRTENGNATIGITDYAQSELGDVVYVELPEVGKTLKQNDSIGTIEAVKTVADIYAPVSGEVLEVNTELDGKPELINGDPYGDGWMIKIKTTNPSELDSLMDAETYKQHVAEAS